MESTNNFLNWVEIKNFKSIKDLRLDCKRVNVFIGKPNVGKSNILEALGLLGADYSVEKFTDGAARYKEIKHLFRDNDLSQIIRIISDKYLVHLNTYLLNPGMEFEYNLSEYKPSKDTNIPKHTYSLLIQKDGKFRHNPFGNDNYKTNHIDVKKYDFTNLTEFTNLFQGFLLPPIGHNLYEIVRRNKNLWGEFAKLFTEQQLELVLFDAEQEFILQKKEGPYVTQYPFFSIADTFRRFMFYLTAIESNTDSVIVLEEPEVHSFPPYVQTLAFRMIESETNQFFVSTHSPYLLQTLIENLKDDQLNVFITYYEDYQTKVRALTPEELSEVQEYSIDVFYNLRRFTPPVNA